MKNDLPKYLSGNPNLRIKSVSDVLAFNEKDMDIRAPYGQKRLEGTMTDTTSADQLKKIIEEGQKTARNYFDEIISEYDLDVVTSINNYGAGRAAIAHYPALTLPMGYKESGEPISLTLIAPGLSEQKLLKIAYAIEQTTKKRRPPVLED
jgi:amidase